MSENLHIAAIQGLVGSKLNNQRMPLDAARYWIERATADTGGTMESRDLGSAIN